MISPMCHVAITSVWPATASHSVSRSCMVIVLVMGMVTLKSERSKGPGAVACVSRGGSGS